MNQLKLKLLRFTLKLRYKYKLRRQFTKTEVFIIGLVAGLLSALIVYYWIIEPAVYADKVDYIKNYAGVNI